MLYGLKVKIIAEIKANFSDFLSISLIRKNKTIGIKELRVNIGKLFKVKLTLKNLRIKETVKIAIKKILLFTNNYLAKNSIVRVVDCIYNLKTRNWNS